MSILEILVNKKRLVLIEGDITVQETDAIVNAANSALRGGSGVDGAIHRAGGPAILEECKKYSGCPTGQAVITTAGLMPSKQVIHTVGPIWRGGNHNEPDLLHQCYSNSLKMADEHNLKSISFPSISTGVYGYPIKEAVKIAITTVIEYLKGPTKIEEVHFVLFGAHDYSIYEEGLGKIKS